MPIRSPDPEIPRGLIASPGHDPSRATFLTALLAASLLHAGAIALVSFGPPPPEAGTVAESALEILILRDAGPSAAAVAPDAALSRLDRSGVSSSGNAVYDDPVAIVSEDIEATEPPTPIPETRTESVEETPLNAEPEASLKTSVDRDAPVAEPDPSAFDTAAVDPPREPIGMETLVPEPKETVEPSPPELATIARLEPPPEPAPEAKPEPHPAPDPMVARETPVDAAAILASRGKEIDRLTANLQAKTAAYASRVRRKSVSASTREFRYASYLGAWARKVERIGNLNYPQAARDQRMFGSLILHVAVRSDGSVEQIRVVRSSGYDLLDEAAVRIVELAAPYAPFPPDIAAETDVLDIVRTWQFLRRGGLGWEQ
ncbi:TonB family protein [Thiocapsa roseopersicina]|uniref:Protein TonB n=1 Tax=Thiocapsa roseopersicina TaxID=1058 RepID=A0A1H2V4J8_THIRO|nr:energy transducer TonB [Thiocapsa roseopersicina]SDW62859.1 protein TonB [Thiocapsa roseopersicina]